MNQLLNLDEQRIILMGGVPGAGKSTTVRQFEAVGYKVVCPDTNRGIIAGMKAENQGKTQAELEGDQSVNTEAWEKTYKDLLEYVAQGHSVVLDATSTSRKDRVRFMEATKKVKVPKYAVYVDSTLETCLANNLKRAEAGGRYVPEFAIRNKYRVQTFPSVQEGFAEVFLLSEVPATEYKLTEHTEDLEALFQDPINVATAWHTSGKLARVFPSLDRAWGMSQNNKNHKLDLHVHMLTAARYFAGKDKLLFFAALLHDVGKYDTKEYFATFKEDYESFTAGEKVQVLQANPIGAIIHKRFTSGEATQLVPHAVLEADPNAHFYDHQYIGAVHARRDLLMNGFSEEFANDVYTFILYHMDLPFHEYSSKQLKKLYNRVTEKYALRLVELRRADKQAGSWKPEYEEFLNQVEANIKKLKK